RRASPSSQAEHRQPVCRSPGSGGLVAPLPRSRALPSRRARARGYRTSALLAAFTTADRFPHAVLDVDLIDPAPHGRRVAIGHDPRGDIAGNDRARADHRSLPDAHEREERDVRADLSASTDPRAAHRLRRYLGPREEVVRDGDTGREERVILDVRELRY